MRETDNIWIKPYDLPALLPLDTCSLLDDAERYTVNGLVRNATRIGGKRLLEIGTYRGALMAQLSRIDPAMELHTLSIRRQDAAPNTVELLPDDEIGGLAKAAGVAFTQHLGDSVEFDIKALGVFNVIVIDGAHDYFHALSDTLRCWPLLAPYGLMIWHDCDNPLGPTGVRKAIETCEGVGMFEALKVKGTCLAFVLKGGSL